MITDTRAAVLAALAEGTPIERPVVLVGAHPDDDVLATGGRLHVFRHLTLVQLTDGAPRSGLDARRLGFAGNADYAAAREEEAQRALAKLGIDCRRICLGAPDQDSIHLAARLTDSVARELRDAAAVLTHPYEGGHPDHDTAALLVARACLTLERVEHRAPVRLEFASYHLRHERMVTGAFWPSSDLAEVTVRLSPEIADRKRRALSAYASQAAMLSSFDPDLERYRLAPDYDFSQGPPPGRALYDRFGWEMTLARWQAAARSYLAQ